MKCIFPGSPDCRGHDYSHNLPSSSFHQGHFFPALPGNSCADLSGPALCSASVFCAGRTASTSGLACPRMRISILLTGPAACWATGDFATFPTVQRSQLLISSPEVCLPRKLSVKPELSGNWKQKPDFCCFYGKKSTPHPTFLKTLPWSIELRLWACRDERAGSSKRDWRWNQKNKSPLPGCAFHPR